MNAAAASTSVLTGLHDMLDDLEDLYRDIHSHPELSLEERRTAALAATRLRASR